MKRILCVRLPNWPLQRLVVAGRDGRNDAPSRNFVDRRRSRAPTPQGLVLAESSDRRSPCVTADGRPAVELVGGVRRPTPNQYNFGPILVYARDPRRGECIVTCSRAAHACGVRPGMPLAEAEALAVRAEQAFNLSCVHDPAADLAALAKLAEACERFSPLVGWETIESHADSSQLGPSALFLDITGIGVLFGGEALLLAAAREEFVSQGYRVKLAIAETIGAAWALTFGGNDLAPLPIHTLRVPYETVDLLAQLGVQTIGQLLELPRDSLASRFGERLPLRLAQALGEAGEVIAPHHPPPLYEADWILDVPRDDWECLELIFQELLKRITAAMVLRQEGAVQLVCRLDCAGTAPLKLEVGLFRPSAVAKHLWELVRMQLEQRPLLGPVGRITVQVVQSAPLECRQSELFDGSVLEGTRELSLLIDRLSGRLGMDAVVRPELARDPLPEKAFREVPLAGTTNPKRRRTSPQSRVRGPQSKRTTSTVDCGLETRDCQTSVLFRPLELLDPPVMLEVLSVIPDGPPIRFSFRGHVHRVARYWGPERIETGWWRGPSVRRDYYRVETAEGERFWLFRRLEDGAWGMQGLFA